jgi:non-ribosomal peptide synthetase component F
LLLGHHGGHAEIVFGAAFSGRPAELPSSDRMIGHFVNNLPVRVPLFAPTTLSDLAQRLQRQLGQLAEHQHASLPRIEACSELPWTARLFSTLVVFQNYLGSDLHLGAARLEDLHSPVRTNYPLTLVINPGRQLALTVISQSDVADLSALTALGDQLSTLLRAFRGSATVAELQALLPPSASLTSSAAISSPIRLTENTTELERTIAEIWHEAFGREVSVEENFFDLGGHSLLMLRVHARLSAKLAREIPVVKLFQHPSIRALARALGDSEPAEPSAAISAAQDRAAKARAAMARRPLNSRPT